MKRWLKRTAVGLAALLGALLLAAYYFSADPFKPVLLAQLERALGRRVELMGPARFVVVPRPGVALEQVVIHERPDFGVEPVAYVASLEISPSFLGLLKGRFEPAALRLVEPSINLMKRPSGGWNLQAFFDETLARQRPARSLETIEVRAGRINVKFGDRKSTQYLANTDLSLEAAPENADRFGLRFEGEPARTDRAARAFGRLSGRGVLDWNPGDASRSRVELSLALERSAVAEWATLLGGRSIGLGGFVSAQGRLRGTLARLEIRGAVEVAEIERLRLPLPLAGTGGIGFEGTLDWSQQSFQLDTLAPEGQALPVSGRVRAMNILSEPRWAALITLRALPVESLRSLAGEIGWEWPAAVTPAGEVSGVLGYNGSSGVQGAVELRGGALSLGEEESLSAATAVFKVNGPRWELLPTELLSTGPSRTAPAAISLDGRLDVNSGSREFRFQTSRFPLARFRALAQAAAEPLPGWLAAVDGGQIAGVVRYQGGAPNASPWTGEFALQDAHLPLEGLSAPIHLNSADVRLAPSALTLSRLEGSAGDIGFRGAAHVPARQRQPLELRLTLGEVDGGGLHRLFGPALHRGGSLIARTLRRPEPLPEWLRSSRIRAELQLDSLEGGGYRLERPRIRLTSAGGGVEVYFLSGEVEKGDFTASVHLDLRPADPALSGTVRLAGLPVLRGRADLDAHVTAQVLPLEAFANLNLDGDFRAQDVHFPLEPAWPALSGCISYSPGSTPPLVFSGLAALTPEGLRRGHGSADVDGQLILEFGERPPLVRFSGRIVRLDVQLNAPRAGRAARAGNQFPAKMLLGGSLRR